MAQAPVAFDGSIPATYDRLLGPMLFEPYARDIVQRLHLGRTPRVLEIACGTGRVTRHLLASMGGNALLTATDLSPSMLLEARVRIGDDRRVTWQEADAMKLPFEDGAFDAVVCQFGVMFFPDKALGLAEMHRVLAPRGRLAFNTWDSMEQNPYAAVASRAVKEFFPFDPPTFFDIPFGMHDVTALEALTTDAGFTKVQVTTRADVMKCARTLDAATGFVRGNPMINALKERGVADVDAIIRAVEAAFRREFGDSPMRSTMQAHVVTAHKAALPG